MKTTNCQICGIEIPDVWRRKYCSKCRKIRDKELQREKDARQKELRANRRN